MTALFDQIAFDTATFDGSASLGLNSSDTVVFNGYGLQNSEIVSKELDESSGAKRNIRRKQNPREDGQQIETDFFPQRNILIDGAIFKSTSALLEAEIDRMKKYLSLQNGLLEITKDGVKRVYTASVSNFDSLFSRRTGGDVTRAPFMINFLCTEPFGKSESRIVDSYFGAAVSPYNFEIYNDGNFKTKPIFFVAFDAVTTGTVLNLKNNTTSKEIEITQAFTAGDLLEVNCETKEVLLNGVLIDFDGYFFDLLPDANSLTLTITAANFSVTLTNKYYLTYL